MFLNLENDAKHSSVDTIQSIIIETQNLDKYSEVRYSIPQFTAVLN